MLNPLSSLRTYFSALRTQQEKWRRVEKILDGLSNAPASILNYKEQDALIKLCRVVGESLHINDLENVELEILEAVTKKSHLAGGPDCRLSLLDNLGKMGSGS